MSERNDLPAPLVPIQNLPAIGTPGYTPEVHRQRTEAFERAYPADGEQSGREVQHRGPDAGDLRTLPEYERPWVEDPRLEAYHEPSGVTLASHDREIFDAMRPIALQYNVTPRQFAALAREVMRISAEKQGAVIENADQQAEADLKKQWGGQYDTVMSDAREFMTLHATPNEKRALDLFVEGAPGLRVGSLPSIVNLLARAQRAMRGQGTIDPATGGSWSQPQTAAPPALRGAEALKAEIKRLEAAHPLGERTRAQDAQIRALYEQLYRDEPEDARPGGRR